MTQENYFDLFNSQSQSTKRSKYKFKFVETPKSRNDNYLDSIEDLVNSNLQSNQKMIDLAAKIREEQKQKNEANLSQLNISQLIYGGESQEVRRIEFRIDQALTALNEVTETPYKEELDKLKQVKKLVTQSIDTYFSGLQEQLEQIREMRIRQFHTQMRQQILEVKNNLIEEEILFAEQELQKIEQLISQFQQPLEIGLIMSSEPLYQLPELLRRIIRLDSRQSFKMLPTTINTIPAANPNCKKLITLKSKQLEQNLLPEEMYCFHKGRLIMAQDEKLHMIILKTQLELPQETLLLTYDNYIILVGQQVNDQPSDKIFKYSQKEKNILDLPNLPFKTSFGQATIIKSTLYYWGGYSYNNGQQFNNRHGFKYDLETNESSRIESMQLPRINGQCISSNSMIYLTGGHINKMAVNHLIECYDINTQQMKTIDILNRMTYQPQLRGHSLYIPKSNEILLIGGSTMTNTSTHAQILDLRQRTIKQSTLQLPAISISGTTSPIINNKCLYIFNRKESTIELIQITLDSHQTKLIMEI